MLESLFLDYTLRTVALGAGTLGIVSGSLGTFAVLRGQSLLGDAISHAALPGIALAFLLTGSKAPLVLVLGAAIAGWIGTLSVMQITRRSRVPFDASLGMILSVFFGLGMVLLTYIQRLPDANQAGLDTFLFGQAAALVTGDVVVMAALGALALLAMLLFWKEFKLLIFDPEFGSALGYPIQRIDIILTTLLVIAIVIGLQTVGVVLMSAIIIAPAAAARQWTDRLWLVVVLAGLAGAFSGIAGAMASATTTQLPTGPVIVLFATSLVAVSMLFAPNRGVFASRWQSRRNRKILRAAGVLEDLYTLAQQHEDHRHGHSVGVLRTMTATPESVLPSLYTLVEKGLVHPTGEDSWALTDAGLLEAQRLSCGTALSDVNGVD